MTTETRKYSWGQFILSTIVTLLFFPALILGLGRRLALRPLVRCDDLDGYEQYKEKVKFRLLPGIW